MKPEMTEVKEQNRRYIFPNGETVTFKNVVKFGVGSSGTHRLETKDGQKHIVNTGWLAINLDLDEWTL